MSLPIQLKSGIGLLLGVVLLFGCGSRKSGGLQGQDPSAQGGESTDSLDDGPDEYGDDSQGVTDYGADGDYGVVENAQAEGDLPIDDGSGVEVVDGSDLDPNALGTPDGADPAGAAGPEPGQTGLLAAANAAGVGAPPQVADPVADPAVAIPQGADPAGEPAVAAPAGGAPADAAGNLGNIGQLLQSAGAGAGAGGGDAGGGMAMFQQFIPLISQMGAQ